MNEDLDRQQVADDLGIPYEDLQLRPSNKDLRMLTTPTKNHLRTKVRLQHEAFSDSECTSNFDSFRYSTEDELNGSRGDGGGDIESRSYGGGAAGSAHATLMGLGTESDRFDLTLATQKGKQRNH